MLERFLLSVCLYTVVVLYMRRELRGSDSKTKAVCACIMVLSLYGAIKYVMMPEWPGLIELTRLLLGDMALAIDRFFTSK